jgi:heptosyltransferase-2
MLAIVAGYRERIGFQTSAARRLYTRRVLYNRERHHAARLLALGGIGGGPKPPQPQLYPGDTERAAVDALLRGASHAGEPLIALAPGSIWATKRWPFFPDLARELGQHGRVVVIGSEADAPLARDISDAAGGSVVDATGRLSLLASAELLSRATLLVTNDSAPQHLASAVGTPTVTVFGPTVPEFGFGPLAPGSRVVGHATLSCRPCHPHGPVTCPLGHWRCMRELSVRDVATEALAAMRAPIA